MTKNIAVVAANGKAGQLIVKEAVNRGLDVTAVVRGENRTIAQHTIVKDLFDLPRPISPASTSSSTHSVHGRRILYRSTPPP